MVLKPAPAGLTASITLPVQPPAYDGPELGELSKFSINANSVPGFDPASWHGVVFEKYDDGRAEWGEGDFTP